MSELQEKLLGAAFEFVKAKKVDSIRVSTRPDYIDKTILKNGLGTIDNPYVME